MNRKDRRRQAAAARHKGQGAVTASSMPDAMAAPRFNWSGARATVPLPGETPLPPVIAPRGGAAPAGEITDRDIFVATYDQVARILARGHDKANLNRVAEAARAQGERLWRDLRPGVVAKGGFACRSGCSWCCNQQVAALPVEALVIADHIDTAFAPAERAALIERLTKLDATSRGLSALARARLKQPCALLVEGRCSIYSVRPLRCRGLYSRDAEICKWAAENPDEDHRTRRQRRLQGPFVIESAMIMDTVARGLATACHDSGLGAETLELIAATRIALETPDAAQRYAAGEPIFAAALLPPNAAADATSPAVAAASALDVGSETVLASGDPVPYPRP